MSAPASRLGRLLQLRPRARRALLANRASKLLRRGWWRVRDVLAPTYSLERRAPGPLKRFFAAPSLASLEPQAEMIRGLSELYLAHRFDLLGSGWTEVRHGSACRGLHGIRFPAAAQVAADPEGGWLEGRINGANLAESRRLWRSVSPDYRPIDWQLDFKSGFRWNEREHSSAARFGQVRGADGKVPWELARMQHTALLAHAFFLARARCEGFQAPERYSREFSDQVLDFVATNPPRFGINWASPMEVAIRAANLLAARDLFLAAGATFDLGFERAFERSVYEHAFHLWRTLEWHPIYRGNHYLCEIAGLVFGAGYLARTGETRRWRDTAHRTLEEETRQQFLADGGNIEASTGYHRLSGEAVIYATALAPGEFDAEHFARIERIARFVRKSARPDGMAPQIGDQDSGRFLKLAVRCSRMTVREARQVYQNLDGYVELPDGAAYWDEELRDHGHLVAAAAGLLGGGRVGSPPAHWRLEEELVAGLLHGARVPPSVPAPAVPALGDARERDRTLEKLRALSPEQRARYEFEFGPGARTAHAFRDFGLYVYRTDVSFACIRCGPIGGRGLGAHAHNDALSVELVCKERDIVRDPGTYLYTPLPDERDRYRSVRAHFAPRLVGREPGTLGAGVFRLGDEAQARCVYFGEDGFLGVHFGYGAPVYRFVAFANTMLVIEDYSEGDALQVLGDIGSGRPFISVPFSSKYGTRAR